MTEDEFRSGVLRDGSRLMQPFAESKAVAAAINAAEKHADHPDHFTQDDYAAIADGVVTYLNKIVVVPPFDYVAEAHLTLSPENKWHGNKVGKTTFVTILNNAIQALRQLDKVKKTLFYGKENNLFDDGYFNVMDLPDRICNSEDQITREEAINYIHGVIGIATEAGELLEAMRAAINGGGLDRVNIKEEVGDAKWYMAILSRVGRFMWGDDEIANIAKLRARFPNRFTEYDANNRNLHKERSILEGGTVADSDGSDGA